MPKTTALDAFASLGLTDPAEFTPAMALAVKQRWSGLPVDRPVAQLRDELAALEAAGPEPTPDVLTLGSTLAEAQKEHARLKRNHAVNHWRAKNQLRAALDARDLKFAKMRASRGSKAAAPALAEAS